MQNQLITHIQQRIAEFKKSEYVGIKNETLEILKHIENVGYFRKPQFEALITYIYFKEVLNNKPLKEAYRDLFKSEKEFVLALTDGDETKAFNLLGNDSETQKILNSKFAASGYTNLVFALTMGTGKTILMATIIYYEVVLSSCYAKDKRFAKNYLVFAPDKTIIESLKEIKSFDATKVIPKHLSNYLLNIKYHYLEDTKTELSAIGSHNIIVSNTQKIILKSKKVQKFFSKTETEKKEIENKRLRAIRSLNSLAVFVDEAHHSYGNTIEQDLKKVKQTINYLHKAGDDIVNVVNLTGTPYVKNKLIEDTVFFYGLKEGIQDGILKKVNIIGASNVKTEDYIVDTLNEFYKEYKDVKLDNRIPKIAFYAPNTEELSSQLRPTIEKYLLKNNIPLTNILEYHTRLNETQNLKASEIREVEKEFKNLDKTESKKQILLLVGRGTEGWNCKSLISTCLYRKPSSSIFVLQATTRCLRAIGNNEYKATIFLSNDNLKILDRELKQNFNMTIDDLVGTESNYTEFEVKVRKQEKIKINKRVITIEQVTKENIEKLELDLSKVKEDKEQSFILKEIEENEQGILEYRTKALNKKIEPIKKVFTFYTAINILQKKTHLDFLELKYFVINNFKTKENFVEVVNKNPLVLDLLLEYLTANVYTYKIDERVEEVEVELEALKDSFRMSVEDKYKRLVVYKEEQDEKTNKVSDFGFHLNPYKFDSVDEKDLYCYLRSELDEKETIKDVFFTGSGTNPVNNQFYIEYYNPEKQQISKYFPDILVKTTNNRYFVIEVKGSDEKGKYEDAKKTYDGTNKSLKNPVFAKKIGFDRFKEINKNFEYRITFNAKSTAESKEIATQVLKY